MPEIFRSIVLGTESPKWVFLCYPMNQTTVMVIAPPW